MGTAEKNLYYKEYQKRLKEMCIKQLTNEEMKRNVREGQTNRN